MASKIRLERSPRWARTDDLNTSSSRARRHSATQRRPYRRKHSMHAPVLGWIRRGLRRHARHWPIVGGGAGLIWGNRRLPLQQDTSAVRPLSQRSAR